MTEFFSDIIRELSSPLEPRATGVDPRLTELKNVKAVLFDIYGTLLISGSGDVGVHSDSQPSQALSDAMAAVALPALPNSDAGVAMLYEVIRVHQEQHRLEDIVYPEVDISMVWQDVLNRFCEEGWIDVVLTRQQRERFAVEYECRVNPVWPMPGMEETVRFLRESGRSLGVVSNAQFFTPLLFPALCGQSLEEMGFHSGLQYFSYRYLRAKPGEFLYSQAVDTLRTMGIEPPQTLYVGNDMLKDITPASRIGFRTALFAGDARSFRMRENDERVKDFQPDLVVTELTQLLQVLGVG
jgi:putative hydrolase of the HAD superfamily